MKDKKQDTSEIMTEVLVTIQEEECDVDANKINKSKNTSDTKADDTIVASSSISLSKAWSDIACHTTIYNGGKIVYCEGIVPNLSGIHPSDPPSEMAGSGELSGGPFFLAMCHGDVAIIDAIRGTKVRTLRRGLVGVGSASIMDNQFQSSPDIEEDGSLDMDAITCFCVSHTKGESMPNCGTIHVITASRNTILRHYDLSALHSSAMVHSPTITSPRVLGGSNKSHELPITCMEFHPSNIFFATSSVDGTTKVWDLRGGYATHSFKETKHTSLAASARITALSWVPSPSTLTLAIGYETGKIHIYNLLLQQTQHQHPIILHDHLSAVTSLKWTSNGTILVTAGRDAIINVWSQVDSQPGSRQNDEDVNVQVNRSNRSSKKRKKSETSQQLTTGTATSTRTYKRIVTKPVYEQIEGLEIIPQYEDDQDSSSNLLTIATAGSKGQVRIWKGIADTSTATNNKQQLMIQDLHCIERQSENDMFGEERGGYRSLLLVTPSTADRSNDKNQRTVIAAVDAEHNITLLSIPKLFVERTIVGHNDEILDLRLIPNVKHRRPFPLMDAMNNNENDEMTIQQLPTYRKIVVATNSPQVRLFDLDTFSCQAFYGHTDTVLALDVSPCGRYLVTCGKDKTMRLWHVMTSKCIGIAIGHTEAIGATALSRKVGKYEVTGKASESGAGAFACTASRDRTLKIWALPGGKMGEEEEEDLIQPTVSKLNDNGKKIENKKQNVRNLVAIASTRAHDKDINVVSVAPNDSLIATGSQDKTVKLWRSSDLSLLGTLVGHKRGVWDCQFSPLDRVVATASVDQTVKLWSLSSFDCLRTFQGHTSSVLRVRFLTAGLQLASSGADGLVKLWTIRTNECEATMDGHTDKIWALDVVDGLMVSAGADSRIVVWRDTTSQEEEARREAEEQVLLKEQQLSNHLRFNEYEQALELALELNKPHQALKVLTTLIENAIENGSEDTLVTLKRHVSGWPMDRIQQLLRYCREWNTRARNSQVAMWIVRAIFGAIPVTTLASTEGVPELLAHITPYAERHFDRLDRIYSNSYLLDFTLFSMGKLLPEDEIEKEDKGWQHRSKLVLPPKHIVAQIHKAKGIIVDEQKMSQAAETDVITIGDSDTDDEDSAENSSS